MSKSFVFLALAILSEVFGTTMLKLSEGFTVIYPSVGVIVGFILSFFFLGHSLKRIQLSTAYAIWSGLGTAFTAIIGFSVFYEQLSFLKVVALMFVIIGVMLLNKSKEDEEGKRSTYSS